MQAGVKGPDIEVGIRAGIALTRQQNISRIVPDGFNRRSVDRSALWRRVDLCRESMGTPVIVGSHPRAWQAGDQVFGSFIGAVPITELGGLEVNSQRASDTLSSTAGAIRAINFCASSWHR
jgi:hypothetical protein